MSVYTCYDMIADCRAGKPDGYLFLAHEFVPPLRWLNGRYGGSKDSLHRLLSSLRDFPPLDPLPEREFLVALRPRVLQHTGWQGGRAQTLDLDSLSAALAELTLLERQLVWLHILDFDTPEAARIMRVSTDTAVKTLDQANEALRTSLDRWSLDILRANSGILTAQAESSPPGEPVLIRHYLEIIDGRMTWQNRVRVDRALLASWNEVQRFCIVREADAAKRDHPPIPLEQAAPYLELLGVTPPKPSLLKRLLAR